MSNFVELDDYRDTDIEKSFMEKAGTAGKVPIRKTVIHPKTGKAFKRTYWVNPKDLKAFKTTEKAAEFLTQTVEAQEHFASMMRQVSGYNTKLAGEVYQEMADSKGKVTELANEMVKMSDWTGNRQTTMSDFMSAAKLMVESKGEDKFSFKDLEKLYSDISYQYQNSGLAVSAGGRTVKLAIASRIVPVNWAEKVGGVAAAIKKNIATTLEKVKDLLSQRKKQEEPVKMVKNPILIDRKDVQVTTSDSKKFGTVFSNLDIKGNFLNVKTVHNIVATQSSKALPKIKKLITAWTGKKSQGVKILASKLVKPTKSASATKYTAGYITIQDKEYPFLAATNTKQKFAGVSGSKEVFDYITGGE